MIVGIDGSNLRTGGGTTHLRNLLSVADPARVDVERVIVWTSEATIRLLPTRSWLEPVHEPWLDRSLPWRIAWQWFQLPRLARKRCDLLYSPGGNARPSAVPIVTMSRNMLPFDLGELFRYGVSWMTLRLLLLRFGQSRTFRRAAGVIFLTDYAREAVQKVARADGRVEVIPHGVEERFRRKPRPQRPISDCSEERPLRLLYVSIVDVYKHQWHVAEAVSRLRREGLPISIDFVGPAYPPAERRLCATLEKLDPRGTFLRYRGPVPFEDLHELQETADVFVFASSCENMPNILLEAMASGYPIACARRGPMPELLGDAGSWFDPEEPDQIAAAIRTLAEDAELRDRCAAAAYETARLYSWERCARETFEFIASVRDATLAEKR